MGRFVPCRMAANHCRLRFPPCAHGVTFRPGVSDDLAVVDAMRGSILMVRLLCV